MNPKNNLLALFVLVLMVSCEKELPEYDEFHGYVIGNLNENIINSNTNSDSNYVHFEYNLQPFCNKALYINFIYRQDIDIGILNIFCAFKDINKISGKCFDNFEGYMQQGNSLENCDFKPLLAACYLNGGQCDMPYLPDSTKKSTIHIDKVTDKYITGKLDVYLLPKYDPPSYPWIKIRPRKIHLKTDLFIAVKK
jgi:hypothetical protein